MTRRTLNCSSDFFSPKVSFCLYLLDNNWSLESTYKHVTFPSLFSWRNLKAKENISQKQHTAFKTNPSTAQCNERANWRISNLQGKYFLHLFSHSPRKIVYLRWGILKRPLKRYFRTFDEFQENAFFQPRFLLHPIWILSRIFTEFQT